MTSTGFRSVNKNSNTPKIHELNWPLISSLDSPTISLHHPLSLLYYFLSLFLLLTPFLPPPLSSPLRVSPPSHSLDLGR